MIDYETYCRIHALHIEEKLKINQIARELNLHPETVSRWLKEPCFTKRKAEIYGEEQVGRAIEDALEYQAFSYEYIANILEQRARKLPEPGALHLTRREDLLDMELPEPDLSIYEAEELDSEGDAEDEKERPDDSAD